MTWLYVGIGGAFGAILRHATQTWLSPLMPAYPAGTALVNLVGSFVIGILLPLLPGLPDATRPFVMVGVLGGLTTMSSYSLEVVTLFGEGRPLAAAAHWALGAVAAVAVCALGFLVTSKIAGAPID